MEIDTPDTQKSADRERERERMRLSAVVPRSVGRSEGPAVSPPPPQMATAVGDSVLFVAFRFPCIPFGILEKAAGSSHPRSSVVLRV